MRVLAVDPGRARVGLALSDESGTLATPLKTLTAGPDLVRRVVDTAESSGAGMVIVGLPVQLDGLEGPEAAAARDLAGQLRSAGLRVELWDERFTSRMAERALREGTGRRPKTVKAKREAVDRVAAAILLQSYLDRGIA